MAQGIFVGLCSVEIIYYLPTSLGPYQRMKAERQIALAGGPATNAAVTFSAFGNSATLITGLGEHSLSEVARSDLREYPINLIDLTSQPSRPPSLGSVLLDLSTGTYSVAYSNTDVRKLLPEPLNTKLFYGANVLMLDGFYLSQAIEAARIAKELHIPVVFDGGGWKHGMDELLGLVDYALCSDKFQIPGCQNKYDLIEAMHDRGVPHMAITRAERPIIASSHGKRFEVPVHQVLTLDTLRAGDILGGAFCHYITNQGFATALEWAAGIASRSCTSLGPRNWISQIQVI